MTDTPNKPEQPERKKLSIGGSRPKLGLKPKASQPVAEQSATSPAASDAEPVVRRRKKLVVAAKPTVNPGSQPAEKPAGKKFTKKPRAKKPAKPEKVLTEKEKQELEIRKRMIITAKRWLMARFPDIFNPADMKPMAIGSMNDIKAAHKAAGGTEVLGFGWHPLKRAVGEWTNNRQYQEALKAEGAQRYSVVTGQPVEEVSEQHQKKAVKVHRRLGKLQKKKMKNRRGGKRVLQKKQKPTGDKKPFKKKPYQPKQHKPRKPQPAVKSEITE